MREFFVGRQPIYDRELSIFGYELLFRSHADAQRADFDDAHQASLDVLLHSFVEIGISRIVGEAYAFLNLTREFFTADRALLFPRGRVFMEVLEDITVDGELIAGVQRRHDQGYRIALDDFLYHPELKPLIDSAEIIKLDLLQIPADELERHVQQLRGYDVQLLAEKVETREMFDRCVDLGFEYFQGYFLCRPHIVRSQRVSRSRHAALDLLAQLLEPAVDADGLETIVRSDGALGVSLQRVLKSSFDVSVAESKTNGRGDRGLEQKQRWASILAMARMERGPSELIATGLLRARMAERIAVREGMGDAGTHFTVGLLSVLDGLLDLPLEEILEGLPLPSSQRAALKAGDGELGRVLRLVRLYERIEWTELEDLGEDVGQLADDYVEAIIWSTAAYREIRS